VSFDTALLFDVSPASSGIALHILMGDIYIDLESDASTTVAAIPALPQSSSGATAAVGAKPSLADVGALQTCF
jgi:hypothetical protein